MLHEFSEIIKVHLSALRPAVTIMLREVLTKRNSGRSEERRVGKECSS